MSPAPYSAAAVITAAGSSTRMGTGQKKEYMQTEGRSVLERTLSVFLETPSITPIVITLPKPDIQKVRAMLNDLIEQNPERSILLVPGGSTRQESVFFGLEALSEYNPEIVLIHDGARPFLSKDLINRTVSSAKENGASIPVVPSVNAMKQIDKDGKIIGHLERAATVSAQTPQVFRFQSILKAHKQAKNSPRLFLDDAEVYSEFCGPVWTVAGETENIKITYKEDLK